MFSPFERMVAWRYLRARRSEKFISLISLISLVGIALGVATLIVVMSIMNGVRGEMLEHFVGRSGHINVYGHRGAPIDDYAALRAQLEAVEGVVSVTPVVEGQVMVSAHGRAQGARAYAFPPDDFKQKHHMRDKIVAGDVAAFDAGRGVMIGTRMAEQLGLEVGDAITLISPEGRSTIAGLVPRLKAYPVVGLFEFGMPMFDAGLVLMPFADAQVYFKLTRGEQQLVSGMEVMADDFDTALELSQRIRVLLGVDYYVYNWQQTHRSVFDALNVQRNAMFLILMLIVVVAVFNIVSSLVMLVQSKGRDIAILRTMGASRRSIQRIFMLSGTTIGVVGTALGLGLGVVLARNADAIRLWVESVTQQKLLGEQLYFISSLPTKIESAEVVVVVVVSLVLSFLATLYPARRAASFDPAEALRYE